MLMLQFNLRLQICFSSCMYYNIYLSESIVQNKYNRKYKDYCTTFINFNIRNIMYTKYRSQTSYHRLHLTESKCEY